ncbi:hypothetical protein QJQ45_000388 [Haematococcus lacustris]|nr:hypothetical protein QJQ45_000388 [Haematococcus lacustris]
MSNDGMQNIWNCGRTAMGELSGLFLSDTRFKDILASLSSPDSPVSHVRLFHNTGIHTVELLKTLSYCPPGQLHHLEIFELDEVQGAPALVRFLHTASCRLTHLTIGHCQNSSAARQLGQALASRTSSITHLSLNQLSAPDLAAVLQPLAAAQQHVSSTHGHRGDGPADGAPCSQWEGRDRLGSEASCHEACLEATPAPSHARARPATSDSPHPAPLLSLTLAHCQLGPSAASALAACCSLLALHAPQCSLTDPDSVLSTAFALQPPALPPLALNRTTAVKVAEGQAPGTPILGIGGTCNSGSGGSCLTLTHLLPAPPSVSPASHTPHLPTQPHSPAPLTPSAWPPAYSHPAALLPRPTALLHLTSLDLSDCGLGPQGAAALAGLLASPSCALHSLRLAGNTRLGDSGAVLLACSLLPNTSLKLLDMAGCSIGPLGASCVAAALLQLPGSPGGSSCCLEQLLLGQNSMGAGGWVALSHVLAGRPAPLALPSGTSPDACDLDAALWPGLGLLASRGLLLLGTGLGGATAAGPAAAGQVGPGPAAGQTVVSATCSPGRDKLVEQGQAGADVGQCCLRHLACEANWVKGRDLPPGLAALPWTASLQQLSLGRNQLGDVGVQLLCAQLMGCQATAQAEEEDALQAGGGREALGRPAPGTEALPHAAAAAAPAAVTPTAAVGHQLKLGHMRGGEGHMRAGEAALGVGEAAEALEGTLPCPLPLGITSPRVTALVAAQLQLLDLAENGVGEAGALCLAALLPACPALHTLILDGNRLHNSGALALLGPAAAHPRLSSFRAAACRLTDPSLKCRLELVSLQLAARQPQGQQGAAKGSGADEVRGSSSTNKGGSGAGAAEGKGGGAPKRLGTRFPAEVYAMLPKAVCWEASGDAEGQLGLGQGLQDQGQDQGEQQGLGLAPEPMVCESDPPGGVNLTPLGPRPGLGPRRVGRRFPAHVYLRPCLDASPLDQPSTGGQVSDPELAPAGQHGSRGSPPASLAQPQSHLEFCPTLLAEARGEGPSDRDSQQLDGHSRLGGWAGCPPSPPNAPTPPNPSQPHQPCAARVWDGVGKVSVQPVLGAGSDSWEVDGVATIHDAQLARPPPPQQRQGWAHRLALSLVNAHTDLDAEGRSGPGSAGDLQAWLAAGQAAVAGAGPGSGPCSGSGRQKQSRVREEADQAPSRRAASTQRDVTLSAHPLVTHGKAAPPPPAVATTTTANVDADSGCTAVTAFALGAMHVMDVCIRSDSPRQGLCQSEVSGVGGGRGHNSIDMSDSSSCSEQCQVGGGRVSPGSAGSSQGGSSSDSQSSRDCFAVAAHTLAAQRWQHPPPWECGDCNPKIRPQPRPSATAAVVPSAPSALHHQGNAIPAPVILPTRHPVSSGGATRQPSTKGPVEGLATTDHQVGHSCQGQQQVQGQEQRQNTTGKPAAAATPAAMKCRPRRKPLSAEQQALFHMF